MIYALAQRNTHHDERLSIAQAIRDNDSNVIQQAVESGTIVHIMDLHAYGSALLCIYCCIPVVAVQTRPPQGWQAQQTWHFEHRRIGHLPGRCVGHVRNPPIPNALDMGLRNPKSHGCYIRLGCEITANGGPTNWHRTRCKTIDNGSTYCHLAIQHQCVSIRPNSEGTFSEDS